MIISAFNDKELESIMLNAVSDAKPSQDTHLGDSWETDYDLPIIPGHVWETHTMFGKKRALLKKAPLTEAEMLKIVESLSFVKSPITGMTADFPIPFNDVCRLPFVHRVKRGWHTAWGVWDAPNGITYRFRLALAGAQGYTYVTY